MRERARKKKTRKRGGEAPGAGASCMAVKTPIKNCEKGSKSNNTTEGDSNYIRRVRQTEQDGKEPDMKAKNPRPPNRIWFMKDRLRSRRRSN